MEDDLNFVENERRPQFLVMEDNLNNFQMEGDLNILVNGIQPQFVFKWKMTLIFLLNEDDH